MLPLQAPSMGCHGAHVLESSRGEGTQAKLHQMAELCAVASAFPCLQGKQ